MKYAIVIEKGATSYGAYVPDLPGCVAAAETRKEVLKLIKEAIKFHLEGMRADEEPIPQPHSEAERREEETVSENSQERESYIMEPPDTICVVHEKQIKIDEAWHDKLERALKNVAPNTYIHVLPIDSLRENTKADLFIVLGGDGTILRAARRLYNQQKPILGIKHGRLGFLAASTAETFERSVHQIVNGQCEIHQQMMLNCECQISPGEIWNHVAVNEFVISAGESQSVIEVELQVRDANRATVGFTVFSGDGLMVSTPMGSTAYNFAAGGPIVEPTSVPSSTVASFVITPICAHSFSNRSIVADAPMTRTLELRVRGRFREGTSIVVDGDRSTQLVLKAENENKISIKCSEFRLQMMRFAEYSFFEALRDKLGFSGGITQA